MSDSISKATVPATEIKPEDGQLKDFGKAEGGLIESLLDESITADDHACLVGHLAGDAEFRRRFVEHLRLHAAIRWDCDELFADMEEETPKSRVRQFFPLGLISDAWQDATGYFADHPMTFSYLVATVLFAIVGIVASHIYVTTHAVQDIVEDNSTYSSEMATNIEKENGENKSIAKELATKPVFVGRIMEQADCRWCVWQGTGIRDQGSGTANRKFEIKNDKSLIALGDKFVIAAGFMEIAYDTGAKVILQGPCTYTVESRSGGFLAVGKLTATLEKQTKKHAASDLSVASFFIRTPSAVVTDLGTEFGVNVSKEGYTSSHVFRGKVIFVAMNGGKRGGRGVTLGEHQSARTESDRRSPDRYVVVASEEVEKTVDADYVRKMPSPGTRSLNLADMVSGGDGTGWQKERGINPTNGKLGGIAPAGDYISDGVYHRVKELPYIDGVFIPEALRGSTKLDSAGHMFQFPTANGKTWLPICSTTLRAFDADLDTRVGGIDYDTLGHSILVMRANKGITFDLAAIRAAYPHRKIIQFHAVAGNLEKARSKLKVGGDVDVKEQTRLPADLWVFVDGEKRVGRQKFSSEDGAMPVDVALTDANRFLTLVATDAGSGDRCCWIVFGDPRLELEWVDGDGSKAGNQPPKPPAASR